MKQLANIGIGLVLSMGLAGLQAAAQDQAPSNAASGPTDSLGAYARQVKKDGTPKAKAKVFDNDNLPREDKLSIVGPAPAIAADSAAPDAKTSDTTASAAPAAIEEKGAASASATAATESKAAAEVKVPGSAPAKTAEDEAAEKQAAWKQWGEKISAQKEQIDLLTRELDVLQREYQIRAAAMYADAGNRMRNSTDWDKQDTQYKQQIADKQKALDDAKQKLDDLQEDARKAGTPASVREP
jgi:hypothetical protein